MKKKYVLGVISLVTLATLVACSHKEPVEDRDVVSLSLNLSTEGGTIEAPVEESEPVFEAETEPLEEEPVIEESAKEEEVTSEPEEEKEQKPTGPKELTNGQAVAFDTSWTYGDFSEIHTGNAVFYRAEANRKNIVIGVNAGHGTKGGSSVKTYCHPDMSAKTTGGSTASGSTKATAVSGGMSFSDGTAEASVTLRMAQIFRDKLLAEGYDVLMIRDGEDVQLDNVARTVMANNNADCHIAIHWDGDGLDYDKGCFYISVPDGIKNMEPVASHWEQHNALGAALVSGLDNAGCKINGKGSMAVDLTQTSYSTIPSVDMELGNQSSDHSDATLDKLAGGLVNGVNSYFGQ